MQLSTQISAAVKGGKQRAFLSDGDKDVLLDVILSDSESDTMQVTRHAIEEGSDVSDHVIESPKDFTVEAVLTDDDLDVYDPQSFANKKIRERLKIIQEWIDNKIVLSYFGQDVDFQSVVIQRISRIKAPDTGEGIKISLSLSKITIAQSETTEVNVKTTTAKGKTAKSSESKAGTKTKNKSWAKTLLG